MDEEIDRLVVRVRADTSAFAGDVRTMRADLEGGLGGGVERAGRAIETALARAVRTGRVEFDDLKRTALAALGEVAAGAVRGGLASLIGGGGSGGGLLQLGTALAGALTGLPGRATGGPVAPGRGYLVGERGPELFVPTGSGRVETLGGGGGARDVRVSIAINAPGGTAPAALQRSGRQVARAVRAALEQVER